ncbi:hypothetical protein [Brevibacillus thermoruber]|uniref:hypothetical protein n=1 Tax=Brevibacillus thermoruber TaxID=33942 RepID=UPI00055183CB|nr:hypothetical protein [Brevibacillus thermoruber]
MSAQLKSICWMYLKPRWNTGLLHSRLKPALWLRLSEALVAFLIVDRVSHLLVHFDLTSLLFLAAVEAMLIGSLRLFFDVSSQMYHHRLMPLIIASGVSPFLHLTGMWLASLPMMGWSALLFSYVLTGNFQGLHRVTSMAVVFVVSFTANAIWELLGRLYLAVFVNLQPRLVKVFFGLSVVGFVGVIAGVAYVLVRMPMFASADAAALERYTVYALGILGVPGLVLALMPGRVGEWYVNGWLRTQETGHTTRSATSGFVRIVPGIPGMIQAKDLAVIWRNPVTKIRLIVWGVFLLGLSWLISSHTSDGQFAFWGMSVAASSLIPFVSVFLSTLIFGEIVVTLYSSERECMNLYQVAGISYTTLVAGKGASASLLITLSAILGSLLLTVCSQQPGWAIAVVLGKTLLVSTFTVLLQVGILTFDKSGLQKHVMEEQSGQQVILEQVPRSLLSAVAFWGALFYIGAFWKVWTEMWLEPAVVWAVFAAPPLVLLALGRKGGFVQ